MVIQVVKLRSGLPHEEVYRLMDERVPAFRQVPGLLQKYFCRETATGDVVGVYVWDSKDALHRYRQSDLVRSTPAAYKVEGQPRVEVFEVLFPLRAEEPTAAWAQAETGP
jgi:heme-degrading monooxygenase HmoA